MMVLWMARILVIDTLPGYSLPFQFLLVLGPLLYFYVLKITQPTYKFRWKDLLHFSPLLLEQAMLPFQPFAPLLQLLVFISLMIYLYRCNKLIEAFYGGLPLVLMDRSRLEFRWLRRLLAATALLWCFWIACVAVDYFRYGNHLGTPVYYPFYILFAVIIIWTATAAFLRPQAAAIEQASSPARQPVPAELRAKGACLKKAMEANRYYEDPELNLNSLAEKVSMAPRELSKAINTVFKKSFNDFVNEYRVRDMVSKMQDPAYDNITLLGIAFEAGFNSKATFNRAFKQITGKAPAEFKNNLEKDVSSHDLRRWPGPAAVISSKKLNRKYMFKSYLKIAWRNLVKNKVHSLLNIAGLSTGMAVAILIGMWVWDELSFNTYNQNYGQIAQVARKEINNGEAYISNESNHFPIPLAFELRTNYQNLFKRVSIATGASKHVLDFKGKKFSEQGMYVENDFTDIFTIKVIEGDKEGLSNPNSILLSTTTARALFGNAGAAGQVVKLDNGQPLKVSGVFENLPQNTAFADANFLCPWSLLANTDNNVKDNLNNWGNSSFFIYTQTQPGVSMDKASAAIKNAYWEKIKAQQAHGANSRVDLFLHPMKDWHLRSEWKNGVQAGGQIKVVWLFGTIGIFVLLLACINFMNLSTARSEKRAKEVGIRKAVGSLRSQLVKQFLGESLLCALIGFIISVLVVLVSLSWFNQIAGKQIAFPFSSIPFWGCSLAFIVITACLAGSYPALYLSSFNPVKVLKGSFKAGKRTVMPRKVLLTVQFSVSIILIIGTIVVRRQIQFAQDRPIGYDRKGLIRITMNTPDLNGKYDVLQKELVSSGGAAGFAQSSASSTENNYFDDHFEWEGKNPALSTQSFALMAVTYDYGKTVGWEIKEGRDFSKSFATDNKAVILNEAAVKYMHLSNPVGKQLKWNNNFFTIIGVMKDMVKESPYKAVQQSLFFMVPGIGPDITIRLNPRLSASAAIAKIEPVFRKLNPSSPFEYRLVDDDYALKFAAEQRIGTLSTIFAILAVFVSCLGIFGLASFVAEQRVKEIGVRKILGASVLGLWRLLSADFIVIVFVSFVIATPIAFYFMHGWLHNYEYGTDLSWWIFAVTGLCVLLITLITVSFQSIKAAIANPVKSLRTE